MNFFTKVIHLEGAENILIHPNIEDTLTPYTIQSLKDEDIIEYKQIEKQQLLSTSLAYVQFKKTVFRNIRFVDTEWIRLECTDVIFENCDFSNIAFIDAVFHRVTFKNCKLMGTNFADTNIQDCSFEECVSRLSNYSYAKMNRISFTDCQLDQTEWVEVDWKKLQLT